MAVRPEVVVVSGHMVDKPDRPEPRFPPEQVPRVTRQLRDQLERWDVGRGTTLVRGGARGADIIAAEAALARGAALWLVLARDPDDFVSGSVALPATDWEERFRALLARSAVEVVGGSDDEVYARTNERIIERAREIDEHPHALIVWNGSQGDGPGGTSASFPQFRHRSADQRLARVWCRTVSSTHGQSATLHVVRRERKSR